MAGKQKPARRRPQRMCVACRESSGKRALVRIVRGEEGVQVDPSGKMAGRGAYLHPDPRCWATALENRLLQRALRSPIGERDMEALRQYAAGLSRAEESATE